MQILLDGHHVRQCSSITTRIHNPSYSNIYTTHAVQRTIRDMQFQSIDLSHIALSSVIVPDPFGI